MAVHEDQSPLWSEQCHDPYIFPTNHYEAMVQENSSQIFISNDPIQIKVIEIGNADFVFTQTSALQDHLCTSHFSGTRLMWVTYLECVFVMGGADLASLIPQPYSWDQMSITEETFGFLSRHFTIFPVFADMLCAFGKAAASQNATLGGCYSWEHGELAETCYTLKIAEKHGRAEPDEPWSIRQIGIYHQHDSGKDIDTFIFLNPVMSLQERLKSAMRNCNQLPDRQDIHNLAFSHSNVGWRWYLSFWESKLNDLMLKAHASQMDGKPSALGLPVLTIDYTDFQNIQVIHDRLNGAKYVLQLNLSSISRKRLKEHGNQYLVPAAQELQLQCSRVNHLLERASSASNLMQNIISFRSLNALKAGGETTNEMARLAEIDNKNMVTLTMKSQRDASALKKMTWLTSIYLPASFASQFLSMGYVTVNVRSVPFSLRGAAELWVFLILTAILLIITFGAWRFLDMSKERRWWRRSSRRPRTDDEKV